MCTFPGATRDICNPGEVSWINQSLEEAGPSVCGCLQRAYDFGGGATVDVVGAARGAWGVWRSSWVLQSQHKIYKVLSKWFFFWCSIYSWQRSITLLNNNEDSGILSKFRGESNSSLRRMADLLWGSCSPSASIVSKPLIPARKRGWG